MHMDRRQVQLIVCGLVVLVAITLVYVQVRKVYPRVRLIAIHGHDVTVSPLQNSNLTDLDSSYTRRRGNNVSAREPTTSDDENGGKVMSYRVLKIPEKLRENSADLGLKVSLVPEVVPHISDELLLFPNSSPDYSNATDDRILQQLAYVPREKPTQIKLIYIHHTYFYISSNGPNAGQKPFLDRRCKVNLCWLSQKLEDLQAADIIILDETGRRDNQLQVALASVSHRTDQIRAFMTMESPVFSRDPYRGRGFNWTITYSPLSVIPLYYAKFYPINEGIATLPQRKNYAYGKDKKVLSVISNCSPSNSRMHYIKLLKKYIAVDLYGDCSHRTFNCPREAGPNSQCFKNLIKQYKFYLAFENTNCNSYVTEKFYVNGLSNDVIPVVMGAVKSSYVRNSPPHSFIHVEDFASVKQLASYLHKLDRNDKLYNEYFMWKGAWRVLPEGELFCRICAMAHARTRRNLVTSYQEWSDSEKCNRQIEYDADT